MATDWTAALAEAVLDGRPPERGSDELDALLKWMAGAATPEAEALAAEFERRGTDPGQARRLALVMLDRWLFAEEGRGSAWAVLGLDPGTPRERAQRRYHRLVQIYHPDRARGDPEWLTERTETLNRAWSEIRRGGPARGAGARTAAPARDGDSGEKARPGRARERKRRRTRFDPRFDRRGDPGSALRHALGDSVHLQRRVLTLLVVVSVAIIGGGLLALLQPEPLPRVGGSPEITGIAKTGNAVKGFATTAGDAETAPDEANDEGAAEVPQRRSREADAAEVGTAATSPPQDDVQEPPRRITSAPPASGGPSAVAGAGLRPGGGDSPSQRVAMERRSGYLAVAAESPAEGAREGGAASGGGESPEEVVADGEPARDADPGNGGERPGSETDVAQTRSVSLALAPSRSDRQRPAQADPAPSVDARDDAGAAGRDGAGQSAPAPDLERVAELLERGGETIARYVAAEQRGAPDALASVLADTVIIDGIPRPRALYLDHRRQLAQETLSTDFRFHVRDLQVAPAGEVIGRGEYRRRRLREDGSIVDAGGTLELRLHDDGDRMRVAALEHDADGYRREYHLRDEARAVLDRYSDLYAAGNPEPFVAMFTEDVTDNRTSGREAVAEVYRSLFGRTATRRLDLEIDRASPAGAARVEVRGTYDLRIVYDDGRTYRKSAPIRIELERQDGEYRISRMEY